MTKSESYPTEAENLSSNLYTPSILNDEVRQIKRRSFKFWVKKFAIIIGVVLVIGGLFYAYKIFSASEKIFRGKSNNSIISQIKNLIVPSEDQQPIEDQERINILLIGIRGTDQNKDEGGGIYLADTIMVLSLKPKTHEVAILSIPRDLWVNLGDYGDAKINAAYAYGLKNDPKEGGATLLGKSIQEVTGLPLDYYIVVDFAGFEKAIDVLGGVDITVDRTFTDYFYPTLNYEYQTISFSEGKQHLNGDQALKFVRSRHGNNGEGSDFARAKRQQKIIVAAKDKLFSLATILNPLKINGLVDSLGDHLVTNLDLERAKEFLQISQTIDQNKIINIVLDNSNDSLLTAARSEGGASILVPKSDNFSEIQNLAQNIFNTEKNTESANQEQKIETAAKETIKIQVRNGTPTAGLAGKIAVDLKEEGYEIVGILNADNTDYDKTVIFDYTDGKKNDVLEKLRAYFNANVAAGRSFFLDQSSDGRGKDADFVIVLGKDQNN